jgi:creatinine amidohydrolase
MSDPAVTQCRPLCLKYMTSDQVRDVLAADPRLIVPVGTTEQHGPHLPFGSGTLILERLADDLSAEFRVLRAPTIEYGVNTATTAKYAGNAGVRRKTLHRFMNDLVGSWEAGGVEQFVILAAHGHDPHQEALSTLRTHHATVRTVDIFSIPFAGDLDLPPLPVHGGELDTSLMMYLDGSLVNLERASDFVPAGPGLKRFRTRAEIALPAGGPGSVGRPSRASASTGKIQYRLIYDRIAERLFGRAPAPRGTT